MLRENRNIMSEVTPARRVFDHGNPVDGLFGTTLTQDTKTFNWKMAVLTDADYRTIEWIGDGQFSLKEAMYYIVDLLTMLFADKKVPRTSLERDIALMLDLIDENSLKRIKSGCVQKFF